jgi:hypothetical protein
MSLVQVEVTKSLGGGEDDSEQVLSRRYLQSAHSDSKKENSLQFATLPVQVS